MNSWASTASKQLLEHWKRSGITLLPVPTEAGLDRAKGWLEEQNLAAGIEQAASLGVISSSSISSIANSIPPGDLGGATIPQTVDSNLSKDLRDPALMPTPQSVVHHATRSAETPNTPSAVPSRRTGEMPLVVDPIKNWDAKPLELNLRNARLDELKSSVNACRKCSDIVCRRIQPVFGTGPATTRIVMFGEAPGADEDRTGEPFVGAAGQLLDKILIASGLSREQVYIMNTLKCRPTNNRTPTEQEVENCRPFFETQFELIQPEYIICWGAVAARALLKSPESVGRLRGRFHSYRGARVMVTYHPSYLLCNPDAKRLTWDDMKMLMKEMGIPIPAPKKNG